MIYTTGTVDNAIATLFAGCVVNVPTTGGGSSNQSSDPNMA